MAGPDVFFEQKHGFTLMVIVVLVVQRQVTKAELFECEISGCERCHGISQLAVVRISAKAAHKDGNLKLTHDVLLKIQMVR
jgi:hypothetical protein